MIPHRKSTINIRARQNQEKKSKKAGVRELGEVKMKQAECTKGTNVALKGSVFARSETENKNNNIAGIRDIANRNARVTSIIGMSLAHCQARKSAVVR